MASHTIQSKRQVSLWDLTASQNLVWLSFQSHLFFSSTPAAGAAASGTARAAHGWWVEAGAGQRSRWRERRCSGVGPPGTGASAYLQGSGLSWAHAPFLVPVWASSPGITLFSHFPIPLFILSFPYLAPTSLSATFMEQCSQLRKEEK